jgi:hypothetical protein
MKPRATYVLVPEALLMFVLKEDGSLIPLKPTQFVLEEHFQRLLEDHLELLAGDLIDPEEPHRWLLVAREIGIPTSRLESRHCSYRGRSLYLASALADRAANHLTART